MPTNRTPIDRGARMPVTPRALEAFGHLKRLARKCTCLPYGDPNYERCDACRLWLQWHRVLSHEVRAKIWEFPCVVEPDDDGDGDAGNGSYNPGAFWARRARDRYRVLDAALRAAASG